MIGSVLIASAIMAFAPARVVADVHYVAANYTGPNRPHPNATWNGHTTCFNYFENKDHCVHGSLEFPCPSDGTGSSVATTNASASSGYTVHGHTIKQLQSLVHRGTRKISKKTAPAALTKRYDTTQEVFYVAGGNGNCGFYNTTTQIGACLWSGNNYTDGTDPSTAGWINAAFNSTCGKQLYVQRQGKPDTVKYIPVLDGCNFEAQDPAVGCFGIYLTEAAFLLIGTKEEHDAGHFFTNITWDFDNLQLDHPENAPL